MDIERNNGALFIEGRVAHARLSATLQSNVFAEVLYVRSVIMLDSLPLREIIKHAETSMDIGQNIIVFVSRGTSY